MYSDSDGTIADQPQLARRDGAQAGRVAAIMQQLQGDRDQRRHRLAHHFDDPARLTNSRLRDRLPGKLRRRARPASPEPARRCRAASRPSWRLPRPQA